MYRRQFVGGVVAFALCGVTVFEADSASSASRPEVHVYLLRGLMGMSLGLDELSEKLKQRGINATVHELGEASALAADAARNYNSGREREIILIGHSFGGAAILTMAEELGRAGVPVALAILIDPPRTTQVSANVRRVVNLYLSNGIGVPVERGPKFYGSLENVDLKNDPTMGHFAIQSSEKMHRQLIGYVLSAMGEPRALPAAPPSDAFGAKRALVSRPPVRVYEFTP